jgi:hypothetical protein
MKTLRVLGLLFTLSALGACGSYLAGTSDEATPPPPANFRELVAARVGAEFDEAIVAPKAEISAPIKGRSRVGASIMICVRAPKEALSKSPIKQVSVTFRAGEIVEIDSETAAAHCVYAAYEPFPELYAHYKGPVSKTKTRTTGGEYKF